MHINCVIGYTSIPFQEVFHLCLIEAAHNKTTKTFCFTDLYSSKTQTLPVLAEKGILHDGFRLR